MAIGDFLQEYRKKKSYFVALIQNLPLIISVMLVLVVHTYNSSPQEAKTEILQVQSQPGPQSEILSPNNNSSNNSTFLW